MGLSLFKQKYYLLMAIVLVGQISFGLPGMPIPLNRSCTDYHAPANLQKISYIENNRPYCANDFARIVKLREPTCRILIEKMMKLAQKNVRTLNCPYATGNAMFRSKRVFTTNAHLFYFRGSLTHRQDKSDIAQCHVDRFDSEKARSENNIYIDSNPSTGDRTNGNDIAGDFAVGTTASPIENIEMIDGKSDVPAVKFGSVAEGDELIVASAHSERLPNCFSFATCTARGPIYEPDEGLSPVYISDCPGDHGTSGSPVFVLKKDRNGKCTSISLVGMHSDGGTLLPDGSAFYYPNSMNDPQSMWTAEIGFDGQFDEYLKERIRPQFSQNK